jgi:hypothetical protein
MTKTKKPSRASRTRRHLELELPPLLVQATLAHLGPRAVNKLTHKQAADIYNYATLMAGALALALDEPNGEYPDLGTPDAESPDPWPSDGMGHAGNH